MFATCRPPFAKCLPTLKSTRKRDCQFCQLLPKGSRRTTLSTAQADLLLVIGLAVLAYVSMPVRVHVLILVLRILRDTLRLRVRVLCSCSYSCYRSYFVFVLRAHRWRSFPEDNSGIA